MSIGRDGYLCMQIIPTIFEKEFRKAEEKIQALKKFTKWMQIDVTDDVFTPGKTFELELLSKIEMEEIVLWDIHLMVKEPEKWLKKCEFIGASRVTGQVEMMSNPENFVNQVKDMGMEAGLAFDVDTPLIEIPFDTDLILLMGRKAGLKESLFEKRILEKISGEKKFAVDGGVNKDNIEQIRNAGVEIVYSGSAYLDLINSDAV